MERSGKQRMRGWGAALTALVLLGGVVATASVASASTSPAALVATSGPAGTLHSGTAGPGPITTATGAGASLPGAPSASVGAPAAGPGTATVAPDAGSASVPAAPLPGWLHTDGATIVTADGSPYVIKAIAWFGMETGNCAPHGLWSISLDAGLAQIASMGFNTIRLPYSNECLASGVTTSINANANPGLVNDTPLQLMDAVVQTAKSYGLNVILDRHRPDSGAQSPLWYTDRYSEATWIADWTMLAQRYANEPSVIGFDLHNEPHGTACWGCGDPALDWQAAATRAGDAVLAVNPQLLIVVEGVEVQSGDSYTWWGGGLADAGSALVSLSVPDRVVYSPHDYPASIFAQKWFGASDYPANLPAVWDANWGYLVKQDTAPVLLGEFGTTLQTDSDRAWLGTLVEYLRSNGMSFSYWSFNPNSGDTGGIVKDDWVTPQAEKLAALAPIIGTGSSVPVHVPAPTATATPPATPRPTGGGTPGSRVWPIPGTAGPKVAPFPGSTVPGTTPGTAPATPPGTSGTVANLSGSWALQSEWNAGYVAEVTVKNNGGTSGWTISWPDPNATAVVNSWGMDCSVAAKTVTCTGSQWATFVAPGQSVTAGVQVSAPVAPKAPVFSLTSK